MPTAEEILLGPRAAAPEQSAEEILLRPPSFLEGMLTEAKRLALLPVTTLREESAAGQEQITEGYQKGGARGVLDVVLGGLRSAGAPVTAVTRTVADPASRLVQATTGISESARETLQTGAEVIGGLFLPTLVSQLRGAGQTAQAVTRGPRTAPVAVSAVKAETKTGATEAAGATALEGVPLTETRISTALTGRIAEAADAAVAGRLDDSKRLFRHVADALGAGEIAPESLPGLLEKYGMSASQFAQEYATTVSASGRTLNQLSQLRHRLATVFRDEPEALRALGSIGGDVAAAESSGFQRMMDLYRKGDNVRRGFLVTQWATSILNAITQAGRYGLDAADNALTEVFGGGSVRDAVAAGAENFAAVSRKLSPQGRARLQGILDEFPVEAQKLAGTVSGEATLGSQLSNFVNPLNRAQEGFFRQMTFDSRLRQLARSRGLDLETLAPKDIPSDLIAQATQRALEVTFAATPKAGSFGAAITSAYSQLPILTTINPFPRYYANSLKMLWEFSPARLLSPSALETIASGTPEEAGRVMSRAMLGTGMLAAALAVRGSDVGGEKWYEIAVPGTDKRIDTRAFGPFNIYLLFAEGILHPDKLTVADWAKGIVGINRVAGTGLVLTDALTSGTFDQKMDRIYSFIGQYFGGFSVPLRNFKASIETFGPEPASTEEAKYRDVRDRPLIDPFLANIPGASRTLPEAQSPTRAATPTNEFPGVRQWTGLSIRSKNLVEQEIDRLGLEFRAVMPSSGIAAWDRAVAEKMGPEVENKMPLLVASESYDRSSKEIKRYIFRGTLGYLRREATQAAASEHPDLFVQAKLKGLDPDIRELLEISRKGVPSRFPGLLEQLKGGGLPQ